MLKTATLYRKQVEQRRLNLFVHKRLGLTTSISSTTIHYFTKIRVTTEVSKDKVQNSFINVNNKFNY